MIPVKLDSSEIMHNDICFFDHLFYPKIYLKEGMGLLEQKS